MNTNEDTRTDSDAFWMPFTPNRLFKSQPRMVASASGIAYKTADGQRILDGTSGLWCVGAGHCHPRIGAAMKAQIDTLDYASNFQIGHPLAFQLAERLADLAPADLNHVFFTNSGSEGCDTALKIALAFAQATGQGQRSLFVGRDRAFHGVGFGGISVGGMVNNRRAFSAALLRSDHLQSTWDADSHAFVRGQPQTLNLGVQMANELEDRIIRLHGAESIAAVIVEPIAGSTGVLVPPVGYLQRLREICDHHGLLLIFDEVITGFGRLGSMFAAERFGVVPDMIVFAKTVSNGAAPLGGVLVKAPIYEAIMTGPKHLAELMHGYTSSGHPLACAAGIAMLDTLQEEQLIARVQTLESPFEAAVHALQALPGVVSVRNFGLAAGVELACLDGQAGLHGALVQAKAFDCGLLTRAPGDTVVLAPPFVCTQEEVKDMVERLASAIEAVAAPHSIPTKP